VLFSSYAGAEVKTEDKDNEYLILSQDDVLAIIEA
jgi:co-chaperonin GroES (HSP10)